MGTLGKIVHTAGFWIRETGQALDRLGCRLQGNYSFQEQLSRHHTLVNLFDKAPSLHKDVFVAPSATVIGDVNVGQGSSIWYGCVLRGGVNNIAIGSGTNIQDNTLVHVAKSNISRNVRPTITGNNVTIGHSVVLHGCIVEDEAFVGMGATLLDGVVLEKNAMVGSRALVRRNVRIPSGEGISTRRQFHSKMSSESNIQPVPSPLTQILALPSKRTEGESSAPCKRTVQAVLKRIKQSPKKVNLVAALVRGMRVEDALLQMQVTVKRAAKTVYKVIHSARANATHNHGLDADRLIVAEAFVGKGIFRKTLSYHAKGRCGIRERPQCRLTVVLRELTPKEEAEIARLRVRKFRKLSKRERQLVPHKLLETKWRWHRTEKANMVSEATMA